MTPTERKRAQRDRDRILGWTEISVKVDVARAQDVRDFAASLPPPAPPTDPAQLSMLDLLDAQLAGRDVSRGGAPISAQGSLF